MWLKQSLTPLFDGTYDFLANTFVYSHAARTLIWTFELDPTFVPALMSLSFVLRRQVALFRVDNATDLLRFCAVLNDSCVQLVMNCELNQDSWTFSCIC